MKGVLCVLVVLVVCEERNKDHVEDRDKNQSQPTIQRNKQRKTKQERCALFIPRSLCAPLLPPQCEIAEDLSVAVIDLGRSSSLCAVVAVFLSPRAAFATRDPSGRADLREGLYKGIARRAGERGETEQESEMRMDQEGHSENTAPLERQRRRRRRRNK